MPLPVRRSPLPKDERDSIIRAMSETDLLEIHAEQDGHTDGIAAGREIARRIEVGCWSAGAATA